jgi:hypothetical protein
VKVEAFAAQDLEKTVLVAIANNPAPWKHCRFTYNLLGIGSADEWNVFHLHLLPQCKPSPGDPPITPTFLMLTASLPYLPNFQNAELSKQEHRQCSTVQALRLGQAGFARKRGSCSCRFRGPDRFMEHRTAYRLPNSKTPCDASRPLGLNMFIGRHYWSFT